MRMNQEILEKLINKMITHIKPNGVSKLIYTLEPTNDIGDEYYMRVRYIVPDDSKYLKSDSDPRAIPVNYFYEWNHEIQKTIKDYFGVSVTIPSSGIRSESEYKKRKQF